MIFREVSSVEKSYQTRDQATDVVCRQAGREEKEGSGPDYEQALRINHSCCLWDALTQRRLILLLLLHRSHQQNHLVQSA